MSRRRVHSITSSARAISVAGTSRPTAFAVLRLIARLAPAPETGQSLLAPFGLVFGGPLSDPRARRGNRGSGLARAWKESQAMIVGGISLEAAPPTRQDYAETASIIVNGRKGLYEHGHRGAFPVAVSSARPAVGRAACALVGHPKAAPQHGASNSYSAASPHNRDRWCCQLRMALRHRQSPHRR